LDNGEIIETAFKAHIRASFTDMFEAEASAIAGKIIERIVKI